MAAAVVEADDEAMHVALFPFLAFGHISPFAQLARSLGAVGGVRVTFLSAAANVARVEAMLPADGTAVVAALHLPRVPGLPVGAESTAEADDEAMHVALFPFLAFGHISPFAQLARSLGAVGGADDEAMHVALFPFLAFGHISPFAQLARSLGAVGGLGARAAHFSVFTAVTSAYLTVPARRRLHHGAASCPTVDDLATAPVGFPPSSSLATVPTYQAADFTYVFTSFHGMPSAYDRVAACDKASDVLVFKTCAEMEGPYIEYVATQYDKPILVTGPLVPEPPHGELEERWATWLSSFPDNAVVFASFGSETFLPTAAATELLLGLEATGRPFVAVLNFPRSATGRPFVAVLNFPRSVDAEAELKKCMAPGFEERVKGRGVVHSGWVQQQHILRHRSVGCYVNHAGFSSVVEGLVAGCRLVLLPMKSDQFFNAALLARELRVGTEVARRDGDGWFGHDAVRDAVNAAVAGAGGGDDDERKWREFLTDDAVQRRFVEEFVRELRKLVL
uniref:Glycosyltransferase n=1 Tax=Oryza rufipogon TaxID=4529 RepID=A0A0E0R856_ORYRU